ncbi:glycosyltransferase [Methanothermobacter thermautotrophicus]|uniref:Glycosyltransferase family 4 protein n=1 Tax=Methanothermobacter thermautotrophicus TaxID=145262 RepID=A0A7J4MUQ7_METTF|nr:glycosyltransferase [Methanothermobacter thermautotrophicus]WBF08428.1 hypothetical protein ISG36_01600 [Methanothermobacter thermautotrophicus]HIH64461.1 glycosyltransferase family 4 protein [Methanothermobacter thermautotrophicus]
MKVLIVSPYFYPKTGGLENYAYNILKRLDLDITVICSNHLPENSIGLIEKIKMIRLKPTYTISNTPLRLDLIVKISNLLKREKFDIVNAHMCQYRSIQT